MIVQKFIPLRGVMVFAGFHLVWLTLYALAIALLFQFAGWHWITIPWVPIALIGTTVAFYLGFKNSQAYDRMWEARKIWGSIVNSSRSFGVMVNSFIKNDSLSNQEIIEIKSKLIYRHIAWLYTLREQLLVPTQWEHVSLRKQFGSINVTRKEKYGVGQFSDYLDKTQEKAYFFDKHEWKDCANQATQIIRIQSEELMQLKFPFPRQFANSSFLLNGIFILLLPLGLVGEFAKLGSFGIWLMIPFAILVSWVFIVMELVGDFSENPFEGLINDIPMLSICRTIEIDLLQMLGSKEVPKPIQPVHDILM